MPPFALLQPEGPPVYEAASKAAAAVHPDPRKACFYARRGAGARGHVGGASQTDFRNLGS